MKYIFLTTIVAVYLFSCKKEVQPALQELDCDCAEEVSADFLMEEMATQINEPTGELRTNTDTIFYGRDVRFHANEENADYTWYLGSEIIKEQTFYRNFNESLKNQSIKVILVVRKKPNLTCLPHDDGYDSIVKYLYVSNLNAHEAFKGPFYQFEGTFRFKEKNGIDSIDMIFNLFEDMSGGRIEITNYDGLGSVTGPFSSSLDFISYRQMWWTQLLSDVVLHHKISGEVEFSLESKPLLPVKNLYYKGRKIQ